MITAIRPYAPQNKQQQSFGAVLPHWKDKLVADPGTILQRFTDDVAWGNISSKDAVDTLEAAKKALRAKFNGGDNFQGGFDRKINWARGYVFTGATK